jgi:hypothetical protein
LSLIIIQKTLGQQDFIKNILAGCNTYDKPYATEYTSTGTPPDSNNLRELQTFGSSTYYAHEVGNNEVDSD